MALDAPVAQALDPGGLGQLTEGIFGKIIPNMSHGADLNPVLNAAVRRLLRPVVRLLLRHAVPIAAFEEMARRVYVEVALADFSLPDKKASASRVSILTGLNRKEVARLMAEPAPGTAEEAGRYNRASRVLSGWVRDPAFCDAHGNPTTLAVEGEVSFAALVRRHSGDMPVRAMLDELLRVGAVQRGNDGRIELLTRAYVPQTGSADKLAILGADVADLVTTIDHNLQHGATDPRFQRKVMYHSMDVGALPAFRKLSAVQSQALLEKLDRWLAEHDIDAPASGEAGGREGERARVGVGIYYFEERLRAPV